MNSAIGEVEKVIRGERLLFLPNHRFLANLDTQLQGGLMELIGGIANLNVKFTTLALALYLAHKEADNKIHFSLDWFQEAILMDGGINKWGPVVTDFVLPVMNGADSSKKKEGQEQEKPTPST